MPKKAIRPTDRLYSISRSARGRGRPRTKFSYIPRNPISDPYPRTKVCKMRYCAVIPNFANNTGQPAGNYQFRLNSLFDPNYTNVGAGHPNIQPMYYDQVTAVYQKYVVWGAKVTVWFGAGSANIPVEVLIRPTLDPSEPSGSLGASFVDEESRPMSKKTIMNDSRGTMLKAYYDIGKVIGVSKQTILKDDLYQAVYNTNPTNVVYLNIMMHNMTDATTSNNVPLNVRIDYYCKFFNPKPVGYS